MSDLPITLRLLDESDESEKNFVLSSWLRSYTSSKWAESMPRDTFMRGHHRVVSALLDKHHTWVAEVTPGELAGWTCTGKYVLHYVYVKSTYRRMGVGRTLLNAPSASGTEVPGRDVATHWTYAATACPLFKGMAFNPYEAFR